MNTFTRSLITIIFYVLFFGVFIYPLVQDGEISANVGIAVTMIGAFFMGFLNDILRVLVEIKDKLK